MLSGLELRDALASAIVTGPTGVSYYVREAIGEGGQGWVFKANYGEPLGFWVVVKVLRPEAVDAEALKRFDREANVLRRLSSGPAPTPNIVRFYDYGQLAASAGGRSVELPFIVLEHVAGQTLADVIRAHGGFGLPIARVRRLMRQVALALQAMHDQRIIHRDLKPSNVMLALEDRYEVAKVTDFGLVKLPDITAHKTVSIAGATLGYAPPEQYELGNRRVGPWTDVFSFASVLYELLSGTQAFPFNAADGPLRLLSRMLSGERPSLARVNATVPRELRERPDLTAALDLAIGRALSADTGVRHASVKELWDEVEALLEAALSRVGLSAGGDPPGPDKGLVPGPRAGSELRRVVVVPPADATLVRSRVIGDPSSVAMRSSRGLLDPSLGTRGSFRPVGRALGGDQVRVASITLDRQGIVALGEQGLYRFAKGAWGVIRLPANVDPAALRGLARTDLGELVLLGAGFAARLAGGTGVEAERYSIEPRVTLVAATSEAAGMLFVGFRSGGSASGTSDGVLVEAPRGGEIVTHTLRGVPRPRGVARLASGTIIVCGEQGGLVEIGRDAAPGTGDGELRERPIPWGRTGHLFGIAAARDGGAFIVGSGGHALRLAPPASRAALPVATLEAVQTTRDLAAVAVDDEGSAWAVGSNGRLLQREGGTWRRIMVEVAEEARLVAVQVRGGGVTLVTDDGRVLEGSVGIESEARSTSLGGALPGVVGKV